MLQNNPELKGKIDQLWNKFWAGGISNPLTAIEQITYLLFMKRLDELDLKRQADAEWTGEAYKSKFVGTWIPLEYRNQSEPEKFAIDRHSLRWSEFKRMQAEEMLQHVQTKVFPFLKDLNGSDLLKSVFLEMFGDPVRNEKGWETKEITDVCDEIVDCVNKTAPQVEEPTPFVMVRTSNIRGGKISLDNVKHVDEETYNIWTRRSKPRIGDILFTREAPMGEAGLIDFEDQIFLGQRIVQYRCNPNAANPKFVLELMKTRYFQRQVEKLGKGSTVKHLAVPDCFKFKVIVPPLPAQNQFATIVEKIEGIKSRYQQSLSNLEVFYGALSQQAFKGELDLSRAPLPDAEPREPQTAIPAAAPTPDDAPNVIDLPDTELLQAALDDSARLKELLPFWLEAYRAQLNGAAFSAQAFLTAAQTRIAELHPDDDFELGADAYEQVKTWVFEALASGRLKQGYVCVTGSLQKPTSSPRGFERQFSNQEAAK